MSNPLDSAIETLKRAEPHPEAVGRAVAALRRPHPSRLVPLTVGVAALSALALWPHGTAGLAWSQVAAQDLPIRYHETQGSVTENGFRPRTETWVDRSLKAYRYGNAATTSTTYRGERYEIISGPAGSYQLFNGLAKFSRKPFQGGEFDPTCDSSIRSRVDLQSLLKEPGLRQVGVDRKADTRVGMADRYRLVKAPSKYDPSSRQLTVYVQPGTARILGFDSDFRDGRSQTTIEYPDRFPVGTFTIPPSNLPEKAYDLDAIDAAARKRLRTPIAQLKAGGSTAELRLVVQGGRHQLWTIWTGAKPNGDLARKVKVLGQKNGIAYGLAGFTSKSSSGGPYGGHAVQLDHQVDRVDLEIPVFAKDVRLSRFVGYATVRNVPVQQVSDVDAVWPALGVSEPIR